MISKLVVLLLVFGVSSSILAKDVDLGKSKGTQQSAIVLLSPSPSAVEVAQDVTIKVVFNVALKEVEKDSIKLKKISDKKKKIKGKVSYISTEKTITFKPEKLLEVGFYEIEIEDLEEANEHHEEKKQEEKKDKEDKNKKHKEEKKQDDKKGYKKEKERKIKEIKYRFYVPEVVNGYMLPVEPNAKINNSTLLGIDSNSNEVRDDVERYVIKRFAKDSAFPKTKTALAMQYAWSAQKILENPTIDSKKYSDDAIDCESYWFDKVTKDMTTLETMKYMNNHEVFNDSEIKDKIYNTRERIEQKFSYNSTLSGNIFSSRGKNTVAKCQINIDNLGE